jgi:beta-lactamase class A
MISRRDLLATTLLATVGFLKPLQAADEPHTEPHASIASLERTHGGRLGVAILNTESGRSIAYRGHERFRLCSTHKLLSTALVLHRVDRGQESLGRRILYKQDELLSYAPITSKHVADGMTIAELCEAAITLSDNTAGNLLLDSFGGPTAWTAYARTLGDKLTRLDRREPELNEYAPGDPRDTTTPLAMLEDIRRIVLGNALSPSSRQQLIEWIAATKTGDKRIRAGVPKEWRVGDKTGSGDYNTANDIAVMWPTHRAPIIVTAYYEGSKESADKRDAVLAEIGRIACRV